MEKEDIKPNDWHRLLIGDNPWGFTLEVFGRTLVIYLCLVIVMRLLGKRMNAQLTKMDLAVMLTMGAIASVPMQAFDRGILPGIILFVCILFLHRGGTLLIYKRRGVEELTQGRVTLLIKEGVIDVERLRQMRVSKDQLFSILRFKGIRHLGQVKRLYSESDGHFSLFKCQEPKPGLSVFPRSEKALPPNKNQKHERQACGYCGNLMNAERKTPVPCTNCGNQDWVTAVQ